VETIDPGGLPLGMFADAAYAAATVDLGPGDLLLLYSDGLVEARNPLGEEYGFDRLRRRAPALRDLPPAQAGRMLIEEVDAFLEGGRPQDDLSVVLLRRTA
jgi:sigma-B regulation protein RsbU (phosphoserine phosphatase)